MMLMIHDEVAWLRAGFRLELRVTRECEKPQESLHIFELGSGAHCSVGALLTVEGFLDQL